MGRAIDMESDIARMKLQIERLQNQVRGMVSRLDEVDEIIDESCLVCEEVDKEENVKVEEDLGSVITGEYKDEDKEEKADNEGNGKSSKQPNSKSKQSNSKSK